MLVQSMLTITCYIEVSIFISEHLTVISIIPSLVLTDRSSQVNWLTATLTFRWSQPRFVLGMPPLSCAHGRMDLGPSWSLVVTYNRASRNQASPSVTLVKDAPVVLPPAGGIPACEGNLSLSHSRVLSYLVLCKANEGIGLINSRLSRLLPPSRYF